MDLSDLISPKGVMASLKVASKKQALQELSRRASEITGLDHRLILENFWSANA